MSRIKICGLKRAEDIAAVNRYLPDYIGFVFAPSRRQVTEQEARALKKMLAPSVKAVGVFVDQDRNQILKLADEGVVDLIQLHGQESEEDVRYLKSRSPLPVIKAVSVSTGDEIGRWNESAADFLLFDHGKGGSGTAFDWTALNRSTVRKPFFLAGGIHADNIREALRYKPYAVDLSGGVETDGYKDSEKIRNIIEIVRKEGKAACQTEDLENMADSTFRKR